MEKTRKTFAVLFAPASLPMAVFADTTSPGTTAPPMAGSGGMMGMMMGMMQMTRMMSDCEKMMADMPMMGKGGDRMLTNPTAPTPKG